MNPDEFVDGVFGDDFDVMRRWNILLDMWRAARALVADRAGASDATIERLTRYIAHCETEQWTVLAESGRQQLAEAERRRAVWRLICDLLDAPTPEAADEAARELLALDTDGSALDPFYVRFDGASPAWGIPEYRRYHEVFCVEASR